MDLFEKTFEVLENTSLNWSVSKKQLFTEDNLPTNSYGVFRNDTNKWLGTVGERYVTMQNAALVQTIIKASEGISETIKGGSLNGGKQIFLQLSLPDEQVETDTVKRNLTALNSHNGSTSIGFGTSNTVVVCRNTFYKAFKDVSKVRHTATATQKIEAIRKELMFTVGKEKELIEDYKKMVDYDINKPIFESVINSLFKADISASRKDISTRKATQMTEFNTVLESELASHGSTLWGLFNAVTYYTNHVKPKQGKKSEYIMTGEGAKLNLSTYNDIMHYIENKATTKIHSL